MKLDEVINWRIPPDSESQKLWERYPVLARNKDVCPTCQNKGVYVYQGQEQDCDCLVQRGLMRHYLMANIGVRYHTLSFDDLFEEKDELRQALEEYVEHFAMNARYGRGMTFHGPLGTGKTFAQVLILKSLIKRGYKAWFEPFPTAVEKYANKESKEDFMMQVRSAEVFSLDEVYVPTTQRQHNFFSDVFESIVRYRVENSLPTLLGTNLSLDELETLYPRPMSLLGMVQIPFEIDGKDARANKAKDIIDMLITAKEVRPIR